MSRTSTGPTSGGPSPEHHDPRRWKDDAPGQQSVQAKPVLPPPVHPGRRQLIAAGGFVGATLLVALGGRVATSSGQAWLDTLEQPAVMPPDRVFSIVWPVLYVMIAAAGWLAWRSSGGRLVGIVWTIQIALNLGWSVAFFGFESIGAGQLVVTALFAAVVIATIVLWRAATLAGVLMLPYLGWVAFAFILNAGFAAENFR